MIETIEILKLVVAAFVGWLTYVYGPLILAKIQGKQKKEEVKLEGDSRAEELYVTHIEKTLDRYEKQIIQMEMDFNKRMASAEKNFNDRIDGIKEEFEKDKAKEKVFYESELEKRDDKIEELEVENTALRIENLKIKGGN